MARARTLATAFFFLLAPLAARADAISFTHYTVTPTTIYPASTNSAYASTTAISLGFNQRVSASIKIEEAGGAVVRALYSSSGVTNPSTKIWDGKNDGGAVVAPGVYTILVSAASTTLALSDSSQSVIVTLVPVLTPPPITTQTYTLPIVSGWNLFSTPVALTDARVASILASTSADAVWSYDPSNLASDTSGWLVYAPAHPELSSLTTLYPGAGYFVHASTTSSLSFTGSLFAPGAVPPSRSLQAGWNLVGSYATSSESIDDAFATIGWAGLEYLSLWKLDAHSQIFSLPSAVNPGDAFWILTDAPHVYAPADL